MNSVIIIFYWIGIVLLIILPINSKETQFNNYCIFGIRADYLCHALVFLPWMFMSRVKIRNKSVIWFFTGLAFAGLIECAQLFLPYRTFNIRDLIANISGVLISLLIYLFGNLMFSEKTKSESVNN